MKITRFTLTMTALMAIIGMCAQAPADVQQQRLLTNHKIIYFGDGQADSAQYVNLLNRFYQDQFRHAQDPRAPYFMLMSRNGQMAMGVGGKINVIAEYDFDGVIDGTNFIPYDIPIPVDPAHRNALQTSINNTALFFTVFGTDHRFGNYQLYIEAKFGGPSHTFKLKKAYATVGDWTLGYTKSTFADPAAIPSTVETEGPNGAINDTRLLLRYMHDFNKHVSIAMSAETPGFDIPTAAAYEPCSDAVPNFAAFMQYRWGKQHVRLSGVVTTMRYRDILANANHSVTGWGLNLSTVFRPVGPLTVYAAGNYGKGISGMTNDLGGDNLSLLPTDKAGQMYAPRSYGYYGALQYNYSPSVFSTVIFSQERMLPDHKMLYSGPAYKYGIYGTANVFWNITPRAQVGAEVNIGQRTNMNGEHRMAYRAGVLAEFSF